MRLQAKRVAMLDHGNGLIELGAHHIAIRQAILRAYTKYHVARLLQAETAELLWPFLPSLCKFLLSQSLSLILPYGWR